MLTRRPGRPDPSSSERFNSQQGLTRSKAASLVPSAFRNESEALKPEPSNSEAPMIVNYHWTPPFMPWFESDFQGSLRVRQLNRVARWIYGDLLRAGWHCDTAPYLPKEPEQLRAMCDCPVTHWKKHCQAVIACFTTTPDGKFLYHPKMVREYERALSEHRRKVAAGKSRWNKSEDGPDLHLHQHTHKHLHQEVRPPKERASGDQ